MEAFETYSEADTIACARSLAKKIPFPSVLALRGDLGSGKSVFARALIRHLIQNESEEVPSPTFTLVQTYDCPKGAIWHYDLYRIEDPEEIYELGWEDALAEALVIIEWPEKLKHFLPQSYLDICLSTVENKPDFRKITIQEIGK